jgi:hypothetical protein
VARARALPPQIAQRLPHSHRKPTRISPKSNGLDSLTQQVVSGITHTMLSIFTLSVLGAFGTANVLTDVTDPSDDDDHREDGLEDERLVEGLGGRRGPDRTARHVCRARDDAVPHTPTSEAFLPAEDAAAVDDNVFDFVDDAPSPI